MTTHATGSARVHVRVRERAKRAERNRPTTRMAEERAPLVIPRILFPDNETFDASDVNFAALFPASLPRFSAIKRFACTRCQLSQVPTALYDLATLTEVALVGNAIGAVPVQFEGSAIATLDLAQNRFADVPVQIWAMPQLETLDLSGNQITTCVTPALSRTAAKATGSELRTLTLDNNPISVVTCRFPNLQALSLYNTSLTALPRFLKDLTKLARLDVGGNPSLMLSSNDTVSLGTLEELDLSSNGLRTLPPVLRTLVPNVKTLRLAYNNLSDVEDALAAAHSLPDLTTIVLDKNAVANVTAILSRFPMLTNLSLANNSVTTLSSSEPFDSLRFLNVSGNAITSFNMTLPRLEILDLRNNRLASVSPAIFTLRSLRALNLLGNSIEPWELSPEQFTFLSNLEELSIDQTAFASCSVERQRQLNARLTVCVSSSFASTKPTSTKGSSSRSRSSDQLLYLGGSFLIAILIALWIFMVRRRRARAEEIASAASNPSVAASPSPIQRAASLMNSPARPLGSASLAYERTRRSGRPSTASGRIPPLSAHQLTREISDQSTFWEDEELQSWRLEFEGAQQQARIAVGVFTEVWRASYGADTVAVKRLKASLRRIHLHHPETLEAGVLDDFVFEIRVLSRLDHPRIVSFFGVAWTRGLELSAIMEYVPQQDLRGFLSQQQPSTWAVEMVHAALCVAEALVYLHTQEVPLIHGNVQAANVLLTDRLDAKLCDFGSAQYCTAVPLLSLSDRSRPTNASDARGSSSLSLASVRADATPWIAPEVLRSQVVCDPSIDMYAFGVLLSEMDTHAVPYSSGEAAVLNDLEIRHHVAVGQLRPAFTSACPLSLLALATRCLAFEPQDRPTSTDAAFALRGILSAISSSESERLSASNSTQETSRSTMGPLFHLPSNDSDSDMSQRTIEFRRYSSA